RDRAFDAPRRREALVHRRRDRAQDAPAAVAAVQGQGLEGAEVDLAQYRAARCAQARGARAAVEHRDLAEHHPGLRRGELSLRVAGHGAHHDELALDDHEQAVPARALTRDLLASLDGALPPRGEQARPVVLRERIEEITSDESAAFVALPGAVTFHRASRPLGYRKADRMRERDRWNPPRHTESRAGRSPPRSGFSSRRRACSTWPGRGGPR